jgi:hypothetical protein
VGDPEASTTNEAKTNGIKKSNNAKLSTEQLWKHKVT